MAGNTPENEKKGVKEKSEKGHKGKGILQDQQGKAGFLKTKTAKGINGVAGLGVYYQCLKIFLDLFLFWISIVAVENVRWESKIEFGIGS